MVGRRLPGILGIWIEVAVLGVGLILVGNVYPLLLPYATLWLIALSILGVVLIFYGLHTD